MENLKKKVNENVWFLNVRDMTRKSGHILYKENESDWILF